MGILAGREPPGNRFVDPSPPSQAAAYPSALPPNRRCGFGAGPNGQTTSPPKGRAGAMPAASFEDSELEEAWVEGDAGARWRSAQGLGGDEGARESGCALLEVEPGCRLPRHVDSAEELVVVVSGRAAVSVADEEIDVPAGGVALVPECVPHEVRNAGDSPLRFIAVYAGNEVTTTYETDVQPDGSRTREAVS